MNKLIVFGRGRSGTTVLADLLDHHPQIHLTMQFAQFEGFGRSLIEPFAQTALPEVADAADQIRASSTLLPYDWWTLREGLPPRARAYDRYLDELEDWAATEPEVRYVGFKIIDNQMTERGTLLATLVRRGYRIVHIRRRNLLRHALSGLIAQQRGVFNARHYEVPNDKYTIDPKELLLAMRHISICAQKWDLTLNTCGAPVIRTVYEEFLADKGAFFAPIFDFLGLEHVDLPDSDFTKMTPRNLSEIIANYGDLQITAQHLGMETSLAEA